MLKKIGFTLLIFFSLSLFGDVHAEQELSGPRLINDENFNFFVDAIYEGQGVRSSIEIEEENILDEKLDVVGGFEDEHKLEVSSDQYISLEVLPSEDLPESEYSNFYDSTTIVLEGPDDKLFASKAKDLQIYEFIKEGEYTIKLKSSSYDMYQLKMNRLKTPFFGQVYFVGSKFDFEKHREQMERFRSEGGNIVVYNNDKFADYLNITQEKAKVDKEAEWELGKLDRLLDNYLEDEDEIITLSSTLSPKKVMQYRGLDLAYLFEGNEGLGNILYLSPSVTILQEYELKEVITNISEEEYPSFGKSKEIVINQFLLFIILLTVILTMWILFGDTIKALIYTRENKDWSKILHSLLYGINGILFIFVLLTFLVLYYFYRKSNADGIYSYIEKTLIRLEEISPINDTMNKLIYISLSIVLINLVFVCKLRQSKIKKTSKKIFRFLRKFLRIDNQLLLKLLFVLWAILILLFGVIDIFIYSKALSISIFIAVVFLTILIFINGFFIRLDKRFQNFKIIWLFKLLLILIPIFLLFKIVISFITPWGIGKEVSFERYEFDRIASLTNEFSINEDETNFHITHNPNHYEDHTTMTLEQRFKVQDEIFLSMRNGGNTFEKTDTFLFFDKKMIELDHKKKFDKLFLYSKSDFEQKDSLQHTLATHLKEGELLGVDKYSFTTNDFVDDEAEGLLYTGDYYKDSIEFTGEYFKTDLNATGKFVFYTYLKDSLDLTLTYKDLNDQVGRDDFLVQVEDFNGDVAKAKYIKDEETTLLKEDMLDELSLQTDNLREGVYKITIASLRSGMGFDRLSGDIVLEDIKINSPYLTLSFLDGSNVIFYQDTLIALSPLEEEYIYSWSSDYDFQYLQREELLEKRIAKNRFGQNLETLELAPFESFSSGFGIASFTEESFFYPFIYRISEISEVTDSVVANSDIEVEQEESGDFVSKITLPEQSYAYDKQIDFHFFVKNAEFEYDEYKVESFIYSVNSS